MEKYDIEQIDAYLRGTMTVEEINDFEAKMSQDPELKHIVEIMALNILAIRRVGAARDQMKIVKLKAGMTKANKRMWTAAATIGSVALLAAAMVVTPVYEFVVAPIVKEYKEKKKQERQQQTAPAVKPLINEEEDSIIGDTIPAEEEVINEPTPVIAPMTKEPEVIEIVEKEPEPMRDTVEIAKAQEPELVETTKPKVDYIPKVNQIKQSETTLLDYEFGDISAKRVGDKVVVTFSMWNRVEDAKVRMHSARARDIDEKLYAAKKCVLNGKTKAIEESWKHNEAHKMEIVISDVALDVKAFKHVSFSFQSDAKQRRQKSTVVVLEVGDIK